MTLNSHENLLDTILCRENLNLAWKRVRANKGAAGIDGITINQFVAHFKAAGKDIVESIRQGHYQPLPVKRVHIRKPDGGERALGMPTVFDRVIQQAIAQIIGPLFDEGFSQLSYGFRPKRSQHQAVKKLRSYIEGGKRIAVDVDLSKFFDRVNHDFLMAQLGKKIHDKPLLKLTPVQISRATNYRSLTRSFHGKKSSGAHAVFVRLDQLFWYSTRLPEMY